MWRGHACETDASLGKGISMSDHWCKGARYVRYATGGSGAYRTCAGLQRGASWASACLAGASRFEALLLNHRRRLPDAIVLVNARTPCSTTEGGGRPCVLGEKSIDKPRQDLSTWGELDEQGEKTGPCGGIGQYSFRSEDRSEAGDRRAMAQDCTRSCSGRTGTRTKRGRARVWP